jgi:hypothetical protein
MLINFSADKHPDREERYRLTEELMVFLERLYTKYEDQLAMIDDLVYVPVCNKFGRIVDTEVNYDSGHWFYHVAFDDSNVNTKKIRFTDIVCLNGEYEKL